MAFKKRFARRSFGRARSMRHSKSGRSSLGLWDFALAGAVYGLVRPTIANMLPTFFTFGPVDSDNVILAGAGYFASQSNTKFIKALGYVAIGTEASIVTSNVVANGFNFGSNTSAGSIPEY